MILDGQQRLTSLYQAFYGVSECRYFVDFKPLLDDEDIEEAVFSDTSIAVAAIERFNNRQTNWCFRLAFYLGSEAASTHGGTALLT